MLPAGPVLVWLSALALASTACGGGDEGPDWMAALDDELLISELSIPGAHDAGALYELAPGTSKNQDLTIAEQLAAGVRYLDIRCRNVQDSFSIYHGVVFQNLTFDEVLAAIFDFLDEHPGEALIMSVMEELAPSGSTRSFEATFADYVSRAPQRWALAGTIPRLGDVRGKIVLLRRFDAVASPLGLDATVWPDNSRTIFSIENTASIRVQDAYLVTDNNEKWGSITAMLAEARTGSPSTLFLNHTSGYQVIDRLSSIPAVSDDINARLDGLLADPMQRRVRLGVIVMDHVTPARVEAVFATN